MSLSVQAQWDGLTGHIVLNKTDGLRRVFDLDIISLQEDGSARVSNKASKRQLRQPYAEFIVADSQREEWVLL